MFIVKLIPSRVLSLQARKPIGLIGRYVMTKIFNSANADLNYFVKDVLNLEKEDKVLEIGFGPGKLIHEMAEVTTEGVIEGVDFSMAMYKQANKINKHYISEGKVKLHKMECGNLPFENESFDKLCSVNTLYFWKKPHKYVDEMLRVIKHGGKIVIGFRDDAQMNNLNLSEDIFSTYSQDEVIDLLSNAGFLDPYIVEKEGKPFRSYCAVATKA